VRLLATIVITVLVCASPRPATLRAQDLGYPIAPLASQWTYEVPFGESVSFAVGDAHLLLSNGSALSALDWKSGEPRWSVDVPDTRSVLAAEGRVLLAAADAVRALDEKTGTPLWQMASGVTHTPLMARAGWVFAINDEGTLRGIRAADGAVLWTATAPPAARPPAVDGDHLVLVSASGELTTWSVTDGSRRWSVALGETPTSLLAAHGRVFVVAGGWLRAFHQASGREAWSYPINMPSIGRMAADRDHLYVPALDNTIRAHDPQSGSLRWRQNAVARIVEGVTADAGYVLVPQSTGLVQVLLGATGRRSGQLASPQENARGTTTLETSGGAATLRLARMTVIDTSRTIEAFSRETMPITGALTLPGVPLPWPPASLPNR
jgi:outer membrane protein assembly factor BamB